jgi:hypothetical protein
MRRGSSFIWLIGIVMLCFFPALNAASNIGSVSGLSEWDVTSYKVNLLDHRGGSGDIQTDQNGWIHLGANHLEGGDIKYQIPTGNLHRYDILEVWIDGYSTSNDLEIGPSVFIGTGKNRFEQITRMTGDAWRPFVFRFADDALYGDITDPSNRNENWRIRYPSSKYEVRRIDKSPRDLLDHQTLPVRVSVTGAEDFIIKRMEVVVYRAQRGLYRGGVYIVNLDPYKVRRGSMVTVQLNRELPTEGIDFYIIDPAGREHRITPRVLGGDRIGFYTEDYPFSKSGPYQVKLIDRSDRDQEYSDTEQFEYIHPGRKLKAKPRPKPKPWVEPCPPPCPPSYLPPIPETAPAYIVPVVPPGPVVGPPVVPAPQVGPPSFVAPPVAPAPVYANRGYTIQIGAYRTQASAVAVMNKLHSYGYDAYIAESVKGNVRLFRVRVGRYPNKSLAQRDASRLRQSGFDTWVTTLS